MAKHVLVVDDELDIIKVAQFRLRKAGYEVRTAANGAEALELIRACPPDVILLDVKMPVMDGPTLCRQLKSDEQFQRIPIVVMTASSEPLTAEIIHAMRADDYVIKPFDPEELLAKLARCVQTDNPASQCILVVDDEPDVLKMITARLRRGGYAVITATDGEAALRMVRAERPDLVVLDLMLPKLDGWRVCQQIKQDAQCRAIPCLMLSALIDNESGKEPLELGDAYLAKPFDGDKLMATVKALLADGTHGAAG